MFKVDNAKSERSGFFPGFFDSDGRPWFTTGRSPKDYQRGLESALKIALLTHHHLLLPAGYMLDNPHLQRLFLKYMGDDNESRCFRILMKDLLRISPNNKYAAGISELTDWHGILDNWLAGDGSDRALPVYLNAIGHEAAVAAQNATDAAERKHIMIAGIRKEWQVELTDYIDLCDSLAFKTVEHEEFPFDLLIRNRLLSGSEVFPHFNSHLEDKMRAAAEATQANGLKLSRSLLRNTSFCEDLGVKEYLTLTPAEYESLAPILGHYHHAAFSESLGLPSFASHEMPMLKVHAKALLQKELRQVERACN